MKRAFQLVAGALVFICVMSLFSPPLYSQGTEAKADLPVLLTSCGQSMGPSYINVFLRRLGFEYVYNVQATVDDLKMGTAAGNPFKSLIIVTGASLKGMGAAGVDIQDELERTKALIEEANKQGITIIGAHVEGMERRAQGAAPGDNTDELSIDAVCPNSAFLIVRQDGNEDRRFSIISEAKGIPLIQYEKNMELLEVLRKVFEK